MDKGTLEKARRARAEAAELRRDQGLKVTKTPIEKATENPSSLRLAINAKCYDCQGQDADPGVKKRIAFCECVDCPLHPVRPYQKMRG